MALRLARLSSTLAIHSVALLGLPVESRGDDPSYVIADLGTLGGLESEAHGINASGQVVGFARTSAGHVHAFLFSGGIMMDLGTLGGANSYAEAINDLGEVAGGFEVGMPAAPGQYHAFLYSAGQMTALGTLGGYYSYGFGINASGHVVGSSTPFGGVDQPQHAFLYRGGMTTDLGTLVGDDSRAYSVNDAGQIAGSSSHAFLYDSGVMMDLLTLGGLSSEAYAVNDLGDVVGRADTSDGHVHAFLHSGGAMTDLGTLGGANSYAYGINTVGEIVGSSNVSSVQANAFIYHAGTMTDLNDVLPPGSGWILDAAFGINDSGTIVGYGRINGQVHAFIMARDCNANGVGDPEDIANGTSADSNGNGVPDECEFVVVTSANPPKDNPYLPGQQPFRDVLQTGPTPALLQGVGSCLTPGEGTVAYCTITITFSMPTTMHVGDIAVACSYTGTPGGATPCPAVSEVSGSGAGPYTISLTGPIPPGGCTTLTFANAAPGHVLRYEYLPGDVNMNGTTTGQDVLALVTAINSGMANLPANLPRYDINRNGVVTGQDVLRLVQLVNGVNTMQPWNGAAFVPCP